MDGATEQQSSSSSSDSSDRGAEGQRDRGTEGQRGRGTEGQRDRGTETGPLSLFLSLSTPTPFQLFSSELRTAILLYCCMLNDIRYTIYAIRCTAIR
jgi:hypothetical protein